MVKIDIENIIASANLDTELALEQVNEKLVGSEYNPDRFPGVIYRSDEPKVVILVFKNGRMMCTAARSLEDVITVMNQVVNTLKESGLLDQNPESQATPADPAPQAEPQATPAEPERAGPQAAPEEPAQAEPKAEEADKNSEG
jgi:hypothetical protein